MTGERRPWQSPEEYAAYGLVYEHSLTCRSCDGDGRCEEGRRLWRAWCKARREVGLIRG